MLLTYGLSSTKKIKYLEENVEAVNVILTDTEIKELRDLVNTTKVYGNRTSEA